VILFATGHTVKALILVGAGVLVIGLVDNLLRPILIGRDTRVPVVYTIAEDNSLSTKTRYNALISPL